MSMVSYAQNHEDVLLDRAFPRGRRGFYIDVGANDPVLYSVTKHFYDLGWNGINVEPSAHYYNKLVAARPRDVNVNVAVSSTPGTLTLHEYPPELGGLSTLSEEDAARHAAGGLQGTPRAVPVMTLAELCAAHAPDTIDFLSVDVEGHEREVLLGADWQRWRPRIVVVEATEPAGMDAAGDTPRLLVPTHDRWEPILLGAGYGFATFDGLNRYYVRSEDAGLAQALSVPVNVADGYVSYGYLQMSRLQRADWQVNQMLRAEYQALAAEVRALRSRAEAAEAALAGAIESQAAMHQELAEGLTAMDAVLADLQGVPAAALGVARTLGAAAERHPRAVEPVRKVLRAARRRGRPEQP